MNASNKLVATLVLAFKTLDVMLQTYLISLYFSIELPI